MANGASKAFRCVFPRIARAAAVAAFMMAGPVLALSIPRSGDLPASLSQAASPAVPVAAQFITGRPGIPGLPLPGPGAEIPDVPWSSTVKICLGIAITALIPCFIEWQWMASRHEYLRSIVFERTRELETEKAELLKTKAALVQLVSRDSLTGVFSRAVIMDLLEQEVLRVSRDHSSVVVVLADLDHFKRINDVHGHLAGDAVLREFARRIKTSIRLGDYAGRYGGEEFLILMRSLPDGSDGRVAELHRQITGTPFMIGQTPLEITCSFGVMWFTGGWEESLAGSADMLLNLADKALYRAKANGRNRVEIAPAIDQISSPALGKLIPHSIPA